jgi:hypothetical protein
MVEEGGIFSNASTYLDAMICQLNNGVGAVGNQIHKMREHVRMKDEG